MNGAGCKHKAEELGGKQKRYKRVGFSRRTNSGMRNPGARDQGEGSGF